MHGLISEQLPRERLQRFGAQGLRDHELIAILLGSGTAGLDVLALSKLLLKRIDELGTPNSVDALTTVPGIGTAKAASILAALEFARRRLGSPRTRINSPLEAAKLFSFIADRPQEYFLCASLNGAHEVLAIRTVTIGLVNATQVHPREVFSDPIKDRACAIVVGHNHPSGQLEPSSEDIRVTQMLVAAGQVLGIEVLDHIIVTATGFVSLKDLGHLG